MDDFSKAKPEAQFSTITTLRKLYTDDVLAKMIIVAGKNAKTAEADPDRYPKAVKCSRTGQSQKFFASIWTKYDDLFQKVDPKFKTDMLKDWLKKGLITDETFRMLTLGNAADEFLNGSLLSAWATYIKVFNQESPTQQLSLLATLTARFGDEAVSTMVETAKRVPTTKDVANRVQAEQIQHWMTLGKTPDDVFTLLKLNTAKSLFFDQPPVNTWLQYMDNFSKANPGAQFSTIATLRKLYTDDVLAKMIIVAGKNAKTAEAGKNVETALLRTWFNEMKTPTDVIRLLGLRTPGQTSVAPVLTKYIALFNKVDPRFKTEMLQNWLKRGLITDETFRLLTLGNAADELLNGSMLSAWATYIKVFNQENPTQPMSLLASLTARFGDEAASTMLEAARKTPTTKRLASSIQREQSRHWLSVKKHPDDIFVLLKLNTATSRLFDQPQLNTWVRYVDAFNEANPTSTTTLLSTLRTRYKEDTLAQMLVVARTKGGSVGQTATRIQAEQTKLWLKSNKTPGEVFEMLQLKKLGTNFLSHPIFNAWVKYTDDYRKKNLGTYRSALTTLRKTHSDETLAKLFIEASKVAKTAKMGKRLHAELLREWSLTGATPVRVFLRLNLGKMDPKVFESPLYSMWTSYISMFKKVNPTFKDDPVKMLVSIYGHRDLTALLLAAEKAPSTKDIAIKLQKELLELWQAAKMDPSRVYSALHVEREAKNSPIRMFWSEYVKAFRNSN
ncbi:hypothetical protein GN244_ATG18704 [Phytophthora infestans]|uniref:RxLR effector PexRD54 WY domain-containing protein n=1 Tax=Phytophthora infestans TaxID=4787 RepID=A0A833SNE5_PHYIN|nr:hypothetical protein GN244_ATG18704 [Phytophthora infestans]